MARSFVRRQDVFDALNKHVAEGFTGDNPDLDLWLIPEGSAQEFIRSGFLPAGITAPTAAEVLEQDLSSDEIRARQRLSWPTAQS